MQTQLSVNGTFISVQALESQGFFLGLNGPSYGEKSYISDSEITAFFSWQLVCCGDVGDLGQIKKKSDSFQISSDTEGLI